MEKQGRISSITSKVHSLAYSFLQHITAVHGAKKLAGTFLSKASTGRQARENKKKTLSSGCISQLCKVSIFYIKCLKLLMDSKAIRYFFKICTALMTVLRKDISSLCYFAYLLCVDVRNKGLLVSFQVTFFSEQ